MDTSGMVFVDPTKFIQADLPLGMQCNDMQGMLGWIIKWITKDNSCHSCGMINPQQVATQNVVFKQEPLSAYMKPDEMLKFWRINNLTAEEKGLISFAVNKRLALPWWRRLYDFPNLLGQAVGCHWFEMPFLCICSQEVVDDYIRTIPRVWNALTDEERSKLQNPSPADLDRIIQKRTDLFEVVGFWWQD